MKITRFRLLAAVLAGALITSNIGADFLVVPAYAEDGEQTTVESPAPAEAPSEAAQPEAPAETPSEDISNQSEDSAASGTVQSDLPSGDLISTDGAGEAGAVTDPSGQQDPQAVVPDGQTAADGTEAGTEITDPTELTDPTLNPDAEENPEKKESEEGQEKETITITFEAGEGGLVAYDNEEGQKSLTQTVSSPDMIKAVNAKPDPGYEFSGWSGSDLAGQWNESVPATDIPFSPATYRANFKMIEKVLEETEKNGEAKDTGETSEEDEESEGDDEEGEPEEKPEKNLKKAPLRAAEQKNITITYAAEAGGTVSSENETVDVNADPIVVNGSTATADDGYQFTGWTLNGSVVSTDETFTPSLNAESEDTTYTAEFSPLFYTVTFVVEDESGQETIVSQIKDKAEGTTIGVLPEKPFRSGYYFVKWVDKATGNEVTEETEVIGNMTVAAVFEEIKVYRATVEYYYINPSTGEETVFDRNIEDLEKKDIPVRIDSPASTVVGQDVDPDYPNYYPEQTYVEITADDLDSYTMDDDVAVLTNVKRVKYIPHNTTYYFVYMLKNLDGDGYSEVKRVEVNGIMNTTVSPTIEPIEGATFESAPSAQITVAGQELPAYYTRNQYQLHYETNGGDYISPVSAQYGATVTLESNPTRTGHTFGGWYLDEELTESAGASVELKGETTVYAKWTPSNVDYTIVYMIENADDDGYSFLASVTKQALAGSEVTMTAATAGAAGTKPSTLDTDNFTFKESTTETIKADGSSVVIVKYSRNVYTISWTGDAYLYDDWYEEFYYEHVQGNGSVTAKYGASITSQWVASFNSRYPSYAWSPTTRNNDKVVSIDTMPGKGDDKWTLNGSTFKLYAFDFITDKKQILNYWLENYEGTRTTTRNGKTYGLYKTVTSQFNYLYDDSDFYPINGYSKDGYTAKYKGKGGKEMDTSS